MRELEAGELARASPIVQRTGYGMALAYSVIEGNHPGRAFVNEGVGPTVTLVCREGGLYYLAGDESNEELHQALPEILFGELEESFFLHTYSAAWESRLDSLFGDTLGKTYRRAFRFNADRFSPHLAWRDSIPPGFCMKRIDRKLVEETGIRIDYWNSISDFLATGFGMCLVHGHEFVSRCYSGCVGGGEHEIDITTAEGFRGQGFATLTASAFIEHCLRNDAVPAWSCFADNPASCALAEKLGFVKCGDFPLYRWDG